MDQAANTHAMRALIELRKKIISGELPGGMRLFEVPLAEDLKISRTPVREAMSRLAEEGLLDRVRGGGFVVRSFGVGDVIDAIELRGVMEGTAARLAAERGVEPEALASIREVVELLDQCFGTVPGEVDFDAYEALNARFHRELAGLCGSETVRREVERASRLPAQPRRHRRLPPLADRRAGAAPRHRLGDRRARGLPGGSHGARARPHRAAQSRIHPGQGPQPDQARAGARAGDGRLKPVTPKAQRAPLNDRCNRPWLTPPRAPGSP
jgi:DNA-binding GntR family transcriptional regulator